MGKITKKTNIRVEVYPRQPNDFGFAMIGNAKNNEEEQLNACEEIARDIRRHVDGLPSSSFDSRRGVYVVYELEHICEFCGSEWIAESGPNGCCHSDEAAETIDP